VDTSNGFHQLRPADFFAEVVVHPELARRLNVDERVVRRMLDPAHETKAEKIQAALAVLGKRLTMEVEDAA
jgi:DNA-binding transcriptional regulator LsrR (DeoR family)